MLDYNETKHWPKQIHFDSGTVGNYFDCFKRKTYDTELGYNAVCLLNLIDVSFKFKKQYYRLLSESLCSIVGYKFVRMPASHLATQNS